MSAGPEPMTFDELSELYRVEMKSSALTQVRRDLFRAMANLLTALRLEYDKQMSLDPESVMCEGAEQRRKKAERLTKDIMHIRTQKICQMAIRGAMGGKNTVDSLTEEEREYYDRVLELSRRQLSEIDRLRGRRNTVDTRIDEIPPAPRRPEPVPEPVPEPAEAPEPAPAPEAPAEPVPEEQEMFDDFPEESFDDIPDEPVPDEMVGGPAAPVAEDPVPETAIGPVPAPEIPTAKDDDLSPMLIRVLEDLPEFAGPDRDYKLFKEDIVTIPKVLAEVLVNSEKAVRVRPTP